MAEPSIDTIAGADDEDQARREIELLVDSERTNLKNTNSSFSPLKKGTAFPLILNGSLALVMVVLVLVLWGFFASAQEGYTLHSSDRLAVGEDIVSALLAEAQSSLDQKNKEIAAIEAELESIESQLLALDLEEVIERKRLLDRKSELEQNLYLAIAERDQIKNQITVQTRNLEQVRTGVAASETPSELQALGEQNQLSQIYDNRVDLGLRQIGAQVGLSNWEEALGNLENIRTFIQDFVQNPKGEFLRSRADSDLGVVATLEATVLAAQNGWEPSEEKEVVLEYPGDPEEVARLVARVNQQNAQIANLETINAVATERLNRILESFSSVAFGEVSDSEVPGVGVSSIESSFDSLPRRIEQLQTVIIASQESQARLATEVGKLQTLQESYDTESTRIRSLSNGSDREEIRSGFNELLDVFDSSPGAADVFPDLTIILRTVVENLIEIEVNRVRAEAEDEILAAVLASSAKIADEQIRLLATSGSANQDSMELLDNLIREIDGVAKETIAGRDNRDVSRALGTVISVSAPNITVRRASIFETGRVRRVFISRILANGDRIPIADAEIIATTGDDLVLRVSSTIAPTIYPEKNDLVFVEF
ncbi:MAG: hypothetical protein GW949_10115 [Spirochaetales bacterium]|nr:hypothetical protein [Spirochaetales bacterium]